MRRWWRNRNADLQARPDDDGDDDRERRREILELVGDASRRLLDLQTRANEDLDGRIAGAVALGTTVLPLTYGLLSLSALRIPLPATVCLVVGLVAYAVLLVLAIRTNRYHRYDYRPDLDDLEATSRRVGNNDLLLLAWVNEELRLATRSNAVTLARKSRLVRWILIAVYVEGLSLAVSAGVRLWPVIEPALDAIRP